MNQEKIGKFIALKRKKLNLTQRELAEKLGVTDRSVSNWENGKNMPDLSLFKPLCDILKITINELMSGEEINDKDYNEKLEENLINTIDYIDKRNIHNNSKNSILFLIIGIVGICLSNFLIKDIEANNYINIISLILIVYSLKQLVIRYKLARKIVAILLLIICFLVIILN